jgi:hypothetical protein
MTLVPRGGAPHLEARAARLLRWYPRGWRDRYGAEFTVFLTGAACWVLAGGPAPRNLFRAGAIDGLALIMLALALAAGWRALHRAWAARPPGGPPADPAPTGSRAAAPCPPAARR